MNNLTPHYRRVLLKIGGEALAGDFGYGIEEDMLSRVAHEIKEIHDLGCEVAVVVGGGNIFRGGCGERQRYGARNR